MPLKVSKILTHLRSWVWEPSWVTPAGLWCFETQLIHTRSNWQGVKKYGKQPWLNLSFELSRRTAVRLKYIVQDPILLTELAFREKIKSSLANLELRLDAYYGGERKCSLSEWYALWSKFICSDIQSQIVNKISLF